MTALLILQPARQSEDKSSSCTYNSVSSRLAATSDQPTGQQLDCYRNQVGLIKT